MLSSPFVSSDPRVWSADLAKTGLAHKAMTERIAAHMVPGMCCLPGYRERSPSGRFIMRTHHDPRLLAWAEAARPFGPPIRLGPPASVSGQPPGLPGHHFTPAFLAAS